MIAEAKGCRELLNEVIDAGLCALCGACTGACPYLAYHKGRVVLLDNCLLSEGQCYKYCPRTYTDMDALSQHIFGVPYSDDEIGSVKEIFMARTTDKHIRKAAQYGGVVTTLLSLALSEGLLDSVVLAKTSEDKTVSPFWARNRTEVLGCASSNYMACPVLMGYNQISKADGGKLGIVAMPCQVLAVTKMKKDPPVNRLDISNVKLVVGLFCTWALSPDGFYNFLKQNLDLSRVRKFDIPPPPANRLNVYTSSGEISFSLDEVRKFTMPTCTYCLDMTSEFADISVGSVEGIKGWNTVIVRTDVGVNLMKMARTRKKLEVGKLPDENLAHLKEAALLKKKRALREIVKRSGNEENLLYVGLSSGVAKRLLS